MSPRLPTLLASILPFVVGMHAAAADDGVSATADADAGSDYVVAGGAGFASGTDFGTSTILAYGQAGYRVGGSTWLLARAGGGLAGDVEVAAEILDLAVGVETRRCVGRERLCAVAGAELGFRTGTYEGDDAMDGDITGLTAALRGGAELRVVGPIAVRVDAVGIGFASTGTTDSGLALGVDAKVLARF